MVKAQKIVSGPKITKDSKKAVKPNKNTANQKQLLKTHLKNQKPSELKINAAKSNQKLKINREEPAPVSNNKKLKPKLVKSNSSPIIEKSEMKSVFPNKPKGKIKDLKPVVTKSSQKDSQKSIKVQKINSENMSFQKPLSDTNKKDKDLFKKNKAKSLTVSSSGNTTKTSNVPKLKIKTKETKSSSLKKGIKTGKGIMINETEGRQKRKAENVHEATIEHKKQKNDNIVYVPAKFNEEQFNEILSLSNIKQAIEELNKSSKIQFKKKGSMFGDYTYLLNVVCYKTPSCPKRVVKLHLNHSLVGKEDDIVIIVADLERGSKVDYAPTVQHYEDMFRENGLEYLKVTPFNQLKKECNTRETLRKFVNSYDHFLCDGRIVGHVNGFCGKVVQKSRTTLHPVCLDKPKKLKSSIEKALKRTSYNTFGNGNMISIPVGSHKFTSNELADNILHVISQLKESYPGGLINIQKLTLSINLKGISARPLYLSLFEPPMETPNVIGQREKKLLQLTKEANEVLTKFKMSAIGQIIPHRKSSVQEIASD